MTATVMRYAAAVLVWFGTCVALITPASANEIDFGRYHALIIGNDDYEHLDDLDTPVADADAIASLLLEDYGFEVTVLRNATRSELISKLYEFREKLDSNDNFLIYYAGHGKLDEDTQEGYWLPIDASDDDPTHWVANSTLSTMLKGIDAKHILLVADSCFAASIYRSSSNFSRSRRADYVSRLNSKRARVVMTSGGIERVLDSGSDGHSVFARAFLDELERNDEVMAAPQLYLKLRDRVRVEAAEVDFEQKPEFKVIKTAGHEAGGFFFVPSAIR